MKALRDQVQGSGTKVQVEEPAKAGSSSRHDADPERFEARHGFGDPFAPLDSDDIEWLREQEAKRAARETRRCPHCGTFFHPVAPSVDECPSIARHEARCLRASDSEREFYAAHRRWPRAAHCGEDEAA